MYPAFDHTLIDVPNLAEAVGEYQQLLGIDYARSFELANINIQLRENPALDAAQITHLALLDPTMDGQGISPLAGGPRNIPLAKACTRPAEFRQLQSNTGIYAIDHLVLQTADADACIDLFGEQMGLRLALDQEVPEWGGRMLFFRHGKMTLEVIQNLKEPPARDFFWGITYLCRDLEQTVSSLDQLGIAH